MSSSVVCPKCSARLKLPGLVGERQIQCPKCSHLFIQRGGERDEDDHLATLSMNAAEIPDFPPPKPKSKQRQPAIDLPPPPLPPSSHRGGAFSPGEFTSLPPSRAPRVPQPRCYDDDDDPVDFAPRSRSSTSAKKGGGWFWIIGIVSILVIGIVVLVILLGGGSKGVLDREMIVWVPAETNLMIGGDIDDALQQPRLRKLADTFIGLEGRADYDDFCKKMGLTENDLDKIWFTANLDFNTMMNQPRGFLPDICLVVKLKSGRFKPDQVQRDFNGRVLGEGEKKIYVFEDDMFVHFPSDTIALISTKKAILDKLLLKNRDEVVVYGPMKALAQESAGKQVWAGLADPNLFREAMSVPGVQEFSQANLGIFDDALQTVRNARGFSIRGGMKGEEISVEASLVCDSVESATSMAKRLERNISQIREERAINPQAEAVQKILATIRVTTSKEIVSVSGSVDIPTLVKITGGFDPFNFNPNDRNLR